MGTFSDASDDVRDLTIGLPPGLVGNPTVAPTCSAEDLGADACPAASDVGDVATTANVSGIPLPVDIPGDLYNIAPHPGEPARFGIVLRPVGGLLPKVVIESGARLRQDDFGLDTVITDIPNTSSGLGIDITAMTVSLAGMAGSPAAGFIRNPTSCVPAAVTFTATSYADPDTPIAAQADPFTPTGCDAIPFSPELGARVGAPGKTAVGTKPPLTTVISQTIDEAGLERARVIMPSNITSDVAVLEQTCPVPQYEAGSCPSESIVGAATAASPLLHDPLTGPVVLIAPPGNGLPSVGLDLDGPMALDVRGEFVIGGGVGLVFDGLPDIPIATFTLSFSPDRLVLNPWELCDGVPRVFGTEFEGHNGASTSGSVAATIEGCGPQSGGTKGQVKGKRCKQRKKKAKRRSAAAAKQRGKSCKKKRKQKRRKPRQG